MKRKPTTWQPPPLDTEPSPCWQLEEDGPFPERFETERPATPARPMCSRKCLWFRPQVARYAGLTSVGGSCMYPGREWPQGAGEEWLCWPTYWHLWRHSFGDMESTHGTE